MEKPYNGVRPIFMEVPELKITEEEVKFQRASASELFREHESICWHYKVGLSRPIIEISNAKKQWGSWDVDLRIMRISGDLIKRYSWDVTVNVLKHEMAHQIVTDLFNTNDGHGGLFQAACKMIGLPEEFRGAGGDLSRKIIDFRDQDTYPQNGRMLDKVRKLLSLAQSQNENEAYLAMKKANEFIEKYNIDRLERNRSSKYVCAIIDHKKKRIENYQRRIGTILREHFFVDVVYSRLYDPAAFETYRTIELLGTVENVLIAEYVYYFLLNRLEALWKINKAKKGIPGSRNKRSYRLGVLEGFKDKLDRQAKIRKSRYGLDDTEGRTTSALICAEDKILEEFKRMRFPRLYYYRSRGATIDPLTFQAGISDGRRLNIHKGIKQNDGFQGRLLTAEPRRGGGHRDGFCLT